MKAKTNIKVMTKPNLTDEEIQSHMDFNKLLQTYHQSNLPNKFSKWIVVSGVIIAITVIVSTVVYFYPSNNPATQKVITQNQTVVPYDSTTVVTQENKHRQTPIKNAEEKLERVETKKTILISKKDQRKDSIEKNPTIPQFTEAAPVDGYPSLYTYFDKELKYPAAPTDSIQGIVTVSFAITKAGTPDFIKIENSLGEAFDAECIRVIKNMPPWKPATMYGKPVQTRLSIPLTFKIKK